MKCKGVVPAFSTVEVNVALHCAHTATAVPKRALRNRRIRSPWAIQRDRRSPIELTDRWLFARWAWCLTSGQTARIFSTSRQTVLMALQCTAKSDRLPNPSLQTRIRHNQQTGPQTSQPSAVVQSAAEVQQFQCPRKWCHRHISAITEKSVASTRPAVQYV